MLIEFQTTQLMRRSPIASRDRERLLESITRLYESRSQLQFETNVGVGLSDDLATRRKIKR